jgi:hypothetical protein
VGINIRAKVRRSSYARLQCACREQGSASPAQIERPIIELNTIDGLPAGKNVDPSNAVQRDDHDPAERCAGCSERFAELRRWLIEKNLIIGGGVTAGAHADAISVHFTVAPVTVRFNYIDYRMLPIRLSGP